MLHSEPGSLASALPPRNKHSTLPHERRAQWLLKLVQKARTESLVFSSMLWGHCDAIKIH